MLCLLCVNPLHPWILHCYSLALFENLVWRVFGMSLFSFPLPGMQAAMVGRDQPSSLPPQLPAFLSFTQSFPPCFDHSKYLSNTILCHLSLPRYARGSALVGRGLAAAQVFSPLPSTTDIFLLSFYTRLSLLTKRACQAYHYQFKCAMNILLVMLRWISISLLSLERSG